MKENTIPETGFLYTAQLMGVIGTILLISFVFLPDYAYEHAIITPGVFHYEDESLWIMKALGIAWLCSSFMYKFILVLGLNNTRYRLLGFVAIALFIAFITADILLVTVESKVVVATGDLAPLLVAFLFIIGIDLLMPFRGKNLRQ